MLVCLEHEATSARDNQSGARRSVVASVAGVALARPAAAAHRAVGGVSRCRGSGACGWRRPARACAAAAHAPGCVGTPGAGRYRRCTGQARGGPLRPVRVLRGADPVSDAVRGTGGPLLHEVRRAGARAAAGVCGHGLVGSRSLAVMAVPARPAARAGLRVPSVGDPGQRVTGAGTACPRSLRHRSRVQTR